MMEKSDANSCTSQSQEDVDSTDGSLKQISKERTLLETFFDAIAQFHFDRAHELAEREKEILKSSSPSAWASLLNVLVNLSAAEKNYYTMSFIEKKLFKQTIRPAYVSMSTDLVKQGSPNLKSQDSTEASHEAETLASELSRQLNQFIQARLKMVDFYEFMAKSGWNHIKNTTEIINCISEISLEFSKHFHHPILDPLKSCFTHEVEVVHMLFQTEMNLSEWDFLSSLLSLRESQTKLQLWSDLSSKIPGKDQILPFSYKSIFSRKRQSEIPFLYQWLHQFYLQLVSKFTLFFYTTLSAQAPSTDLKAATAKTNTDYISKLNNFQKKTDAARISLVLDTATMKNVYHGHGYHLDTTIHEKPTGINSYPSILNIPDNCNLFKDHWPNIISIINEKCGDVKTSDKVSYFYDPKLNSSYYCLKVDLRMTVVLIFVTKKKERDNYIRSFLADIKSSLNHDSLYGMLRPGQVKAF